ncbi:MAG: MoaD/ThiS family protein [Armatimonadota bacterium]|nr:MoaD/ThiS family protein [Armatimonadota bacterium]MDR7538284.1 MoaD/ThiS family protein [Armatimonadota bacterium]
MSSLVEVRLYGRLRRFAEDPRVTTESIARVPVEEETTVEQVLRRLGIDPDAEVSNIFVNGRYSPEARKLVVRGGDRVGVFPRDMAMLYC